MILKCSECGNTFKIDKADSGDVVSCPVCEADFKLVIENGKARLTDFVYEMGTSESWAPIESGYQI